MQSILNMSAPRSGKLYKEKAPRAECFFWLRGLDLNCTVLHFLCGENAAVSSAALTVRRTVIHYRLTLRVIRPRAHTPRSGELYKEKHPVRNAFFVTARRNRTMRFILYNKHFFTHCTHLFAPHICRDEIAQSHHPYIFL